LSDLLVLCYHALSPTWTADLSVTPLAFERQIKGFQHSGWAFARFTDALREPAGKKTVVVTFDDAFLSVKTHALPVLAAVGAPATVFVPTEYVSAEAPLAWAGLDHWQQGPAAPELTAMTWSDLGELAEAGWEIGSHTLRHPHLTSVDDDVLAEELGRSREDCARHIGHDVTSIAYPYGDVDERVVEGTRRAGYEAAAALEWPSPKSGLLRYPRTGIYHGDSWARFRLKIGGWSRSRYGARLLDLRQ
jgi:peptidoglycan/xylan/chitin deacetylase (PgdA/CDA1 family)